MSKLSYAAVFLVSAVITFAVVSAIPTGLWYTFDDTAAEVFRNPNLGDIPFFAVYPFTFFTMMLCKGTGSISKKD